MAFSLPPRSSQSSDMGMNTAGASTAPSVDPSAGASPAPPVEDMGAIEDMEFVVGITSNARKLAVKYPAAVPAVQSIMAAVQDIQNQILQVQQPTEVAAPPQ